MESQFTMKQRRATQRQLSGKAVRGDKLGGWCWRGCQKAMLGQESSRAQMKVPLWEEVKGNGGEITGKVSGLKSLASLEV